jgi:PPOX class probable F420-dependent enzyme
VPAYSRRVPSPPLPEPLDRFLRTPRPAVIATLRADGSPITSATWYGWRGDRFVLSMDADGPRLRNLRRDPRASLTALGETWYDQVSVLGRAVAFEPDDAFAEIDALSQHYRGEPYPRSDGLALVTVTVAVERWSSWGRPGER